MFVCQYFLFVRRCSQLPALQTSWKVHNRLISTTSTTSTTSTGSREATIYVHWPYCSKRCTYCNFNKYISNNVDHSRMRDCLLTEAQTLLQFSDVKTINTVYFGGGTPSLAEPETVNKLLCCIKEQADFNFNNEITLEVNPTQIEIQKLRQFREAGINRVSLGIQSLNNNALQLLGREHNIADAVRCIDIAKQLFPGRVSVDLIFGWFGQTLQQWETELQQILSICDDHISLYQLTLERGTALFKMVQNNEKSAVDSEVMADMYEIAIEVLQSKGFRRYEISNFARNSFIDIVYTWKPVARQNAESEHNLSYWKGKQYIGLGPGAHGRFSPKGTNYREARIQTLEPIPWMREVEQYKHGTRKIVQQSEFHRMQELLMLGMRTTTGVTNENWQRTGSTMDLSEIFSDDSHVQGFIENDHLALDNRGLRATKTGLNICDYITPYLLNRMDEVRQLEPSQ